KHAFTLSCALHTPSLSNPLLFFFLLICPPPRSPFFPYTTLFRSFIGDLGVQGACVRFGVDGNGLNAQVTSYPRDADGDFTAIGNENSFNLHIYFPSTLKRTLDPGGS